MHHNRDYGVIRGDSADEQRSNAEAAYGDYPFEDTVIPHYVAPDARALAVCRRAWKRWWMGLPVDTREMIVAELCILPRGSASDQGWLRQA
jgi:hypothetical protein